MLALDTALGACSAAILDSSSGQIVAAACAEMDKGHAEALAPMVQGALADAGIAPSALQRIAVTVGPGTFTGLRIALSLARGMGLALGIPVTGLDTLTATAAPHFKAAHHILVAHRAGATGRFYAASFKGGALAGGMALLGPDEVAALLEADTLLVGTGLEPVLLIAPEARLAARGNLPDAALFAAYAANLPADGKMPEPIYLREPDAKPSVVAALSAPQVRAATADDLTVLAAIHAQCFESSWTAESLASSLSVPGAGALVVEIGGTIYGFVQFQWVAGEAEINTLCVAPAYRRQHLAATLLGGLKVLLAEKGTARLFLEVAEGNAAAIGLYLASGFAQTGRRKAYYTHVDGSREDAVTMALALKADHP